MLVQRLAEADQESAQAEPPPSETKPTSPEKDDATKASAIPPANLREQQQESPAVVHVEEDKTEDAVAPPAIPHVDGPMVAKPECSKEVLPAPEAAIQEAKNSPVEDSSKISGTGAVDVPGQEDQPDYGAPTATLDNGATPTRPDVAAPIIPLVTRTTDSSTPLTEERLQGLSRSESATGEEVISDIRKRKRRSLTPTPSDESIQKKAKIADGETHVKLPEDESMKDVDATVTTDEPVAAPAESHEPNRDGDTAMADAPPAVEANLDSEVHKSDNSIEAKPATGDIATNANEPPDEELRAKPTTPQAAAPNHVNGSAIAQSESPAKTSSPDARFKNLLPSSSRREGSPLRQGQKDGPDDRVVSPALHPATTALYIRDILRPLHVDNLKDHLIALATPSNSSPDPAVIADFFLDSIRTHCLVRFTTVAAASRVRTGLHDRVWPDEKNRKPLWVDFVPEEKLGQWFEVENSSSGRGQAAKRYEVVYENENDGVKAYLQLVGSNSGGPRSSQATVSRNEAGTGVQGAPLGPRVREGDASGSQRKAAPDQGRGFQALDDLFQSTTAKPKLYYLPVPKRTAEKRLGLLAEGRGRGRGDEMRRYTFEEGSLVDRGPEFGLRGRGGYGGRGGSYRGYPDRGGGYRGENRADFRGDYRGGGDEYRSDYRRDRR